MVGPVLKHADEPGLVGQQKCGGGMERLQAARDERGIAIDIRAYLQHRKYGDNHRSGR